MSRVRFAVEAEQDLHEIVNHIANDNPIAAAELIDGMIKTIATLSEQPLMGRSRPEFKCGACLGTRCPQRSLNLMKAIDVRSRQ